jgi:hypothetical protein
MNFKIYAPLQMQFASIILCENINKLGCKAEIVSKIDPKDENHIWIIYNNSMSWAVPKYFISYQTEQIGTHWFNDRYYDRLKNSIAVWEYNEINLPAYQHLNNNISIVTPGVKLQPRIRKDIDCLFYGDLSPRREKAVNEIANLMVVKNILGQPMRDLLSRTKTVINIHYYDKSPLEIFRINECLSHHCNVISEHSLHGDEKYKDVVRFGTINELNSLRKNIGNGISDLSKFDNFEEIKNALSKI